MTIKVFICQALFFYVLQVQKMRLPYFYVKIYKFSTVYRRSYEPIILSVIKSKQKRMQPISHILFYNLSRCKFLLFIWFYLCASIVVSNTIHRQGFMTFLHECFRMPIPHFFLSGKFETEFFQIFSIRVSVTA